MARNYGMSKQPVGWLTDGVTRQDALADCFSEGRRYGFSARCMQTAIGYYSLIADMSEVFWPEDGEDGLDWAFASNRMREGISYYGYGKEGFDYATLSEADGRIRSFLATDFASYRELGSIYIERNDTGMDAWFVLRLGGESVSGMEGGSFRKLEDGAYLVRMTEPEAKITLIDVSR